MQIDHGTRLIRSATSPIDLHVCGYIFQTAEVMSVVQLRSGGDWGVLPESDIRHIAEGLLVREAKQAYLPKIAVQLLKKFLGQ